MEKVTSKDGTTIAFDRTGEGPLVVVVGPAFSHRRYPDLMRLAELLGKRFAVVNYDRRGRGDSGDTKPYAVGREVEDLEAVVEAAGGSAHVMGLSSGANLALEAAAEGLHVEKLALWEPPYALGGKPLPPEELAKMYEGMVAAGRPGDVVEFFMREVVGVPPEAVAQAKTQPSWREQEALAHTFAYDTLLLGEGGLPAERASAVRAPTLVMEGSETFPFMRGIAGSLAGLIPGARARVLGGQGHGARSEALAPVLAEFFAG
jgi:pimeloyl-ACP methyl ester carboxylesterase